MCNANGNFPLILRLLVLVALQKILMLVIFMEKLNYVILRKIQEFIMLLEAMVTVINRFLPKSRTMNYLRSC